MNTLDPRTVIWMEPAWRQDGTVYRRKYITPHPEDGLLVAWTAMVEPHFQGLWRFSLRQSHFSEVHYETAKAAKIACERMIEAAAVTAPEVKP